MIDPNIYFLMIWFTLLLFFGVGGYIFIKLSGYIIYKINYIKLKKNLFQKGIDIDIDQKHSLLKFKLIKHNRRFIIYELLDYKLLHNIFDNISINTVDVNSNAVIKVENISMVIRNSFSTSTIISKNIDVIGFISDFEIKLFNNLNNYSTSCIVYDTIDQVIMHNNSYLRPLDSDVYIYEK